ncbi:hypothetical protein GF377_05715, partial [candidate division GN15 bacterium]|nr:hypothetical protein [candidate division GN15 bacterium]
MYPIAVYRHTAGELRSKIGPNVPIANGFLPPGSAAKGRLGVAIGEPKVYTAASFRRGKPVCIPAANSARKQPQCGDSSLLYTHVVILVADGARADLMQELLETNRLPNLKRHLVDRGCYRTALTVFPSTTGPAHIPFVCGIHPGTANIPGYRWLDRALHDRKRRSIYRHRSLNSPRGLLVGRDMDADKSTSLFEFFDKPASVLELIDFAPGRPLSKVVVRRLLRIVQAHKSDDWRKVDDMVERLVIKRLRNGSRCVIGSFFGIDEYSHLYSPFDQRTINAYLNIDRAVGEIADALKDEGIYDQTILAVVSDHGLSDTHTHIPTVDIVRQHGFDPYYYPKAYRRRYDSAVLESGNSMAALYFKRGGQWGEHWRWEEMQRDERIAKLIDTLLHTEGMTFVAGRCTDDGLVIAGPKGEVRAYRRDGAYEVSVQGASPVGDHPVGRFQSRELFERTYADTYPDAVNQLFLLFDSPRSGDLALSSEPGYDLRLQHESPEHHGSHGSLHREHMQVPLMVNLPLETEYVANYDLVPTILHQCGKQPTKPFDGMVLPVSSLEPVYADGEQCGPDDAPNSASDGGFRASTDADGSPTEALKEEFERSSSSKGGRTTIFVSIGIMLFGIILTSIFKEDITAFGESVMASVGREWFDIVLLAVSAVSSSGLALPIWAYMLVG